MYYYEISWSWNDSYNPIIVTHEKFFSEDEFKKIVDHAVRFAFEKLLDEENKLDIKDRNYLGFSRLDEVFDIILLYLKDQGFDKLQIDNKIDYFGMYIAGADLPEEETKRLNDICGKNLANKLIKHNDEVNKIFWKNIEDDGLEG